MGTKYTGRQLYIDLEKLKKVYLSCKTPEHFQAAERMANLFEKKWKGNISLSETGTFFLASLSASFNTMLEYKDATIPNGNDNLQS